MPLVRASKRIAGTAVKLKPRPQSKKLLFLLHFFYNARVSIPESEFWPRWLRASPFGNVRGSGEMHRGE